MRALLRPSSSTRSVDGLPVEVVHGDIFGDESIRRAMTGCDEVYYCVWSTPAMAARSGAPVAHRTVSGRCSASRSPFRRWAKFVFTSSMATIGIAESGLATEVVHHIGRTRWRVRRRPGGRRESGAGLPSRARTARGRDVRGQYLRTRRLAAHSTWRLLSDTLTGAMPFYIRGVASEVVGVRDGSR